jgi:2'-5' RNA ligase
VEGVARLFVAVPLTEDSRQALSLLLTDVAPRGLPGRVVPPGNWHVTLRFLGDVDPVGRDRLLAALDDAELGPPFAVRWAHLGAFPRPRRATVLWVGADRGTVELEQLAALVEDAAGVAGFTPEERPFRSHLTLSRIRPSQDITALVDAIPPMGVMMPVDRVVVYQSRLGRGGAQYTELESFPLG